MKPPYAIGSVPSLSGHAIAYRWRSLPRVLRRRASKPKGSFERVLPWQVTTDQLIFASLSHTHYWYDVGMLKVPAYRRTIERRAAASTLSLILPYYKNLFLDLEINIVKWLGQSFLPERANYLDHSY